MLYEMVGHPVNDEALLASASPLFHVDKIKAPVFIIQGANDPRVKQAESDGIVAALRARGVEVRYDVYADEGHGFTRRENEAKGMGDAAEFLIEHLVA